MPDQWEFLKELRELISYLNVSDCLFRSNHASNYLAVGGHLPEEKERILEMLNRVILNGNENLLRPEHFRGY